MMLKKIKKNYFLLIFTFLFLYFFFNLLDGERGLLSYYEKKILLKDLNNKEQKLKDEINYINFKNSLLSDNLDLDFVETLIREKFFFVKENEKIYINNSYED